GLPVAGEPVAEALLHVPLPRLADGHEAAAAVAEAGLERAADRAGLEIGRGVRVPEVEDADVLVRGAGLEAGQRFVEMRERLRILEGRRTAQRRQDRQRRRGR